MDGTSSAMTKIGSATPSCSHPQIPVLQIRLGDQFLRGAAPHRAPALDDVVAEGQDGGGFDLLFLHPPPLTPRLLTRQGKTTFLPPPRRPPPRGPRAGYSDRAG